MFYKEKYVTRLLDILISSIVFNNNYIRFVLQFIILVFGKNRFIIYWFIFLFFFISFVFMIPFIINYYLLQYTLII